LTVSGATEAVFCVILKSVLELDGQSAKAIGLSLCLHDQYNIPASEKIALSPAVAGYMMSVKK
jgi:hypothetical protein